MRSRYVAFTQANMDYLRNTLVSEARKNFDMAAANIRAENSEWLGLKILSREKGRVGDKTGTVEFIATFRQDGEILDHHEVSRFRKDEKDQWFFVDGEAHICRAGEDPHHHAPARRMVVREELKVGRNDPCACGSGKKHKKCCGAAV